MREDDGSSPSERLLYNNFFCRKPHRFLKFVEPSAPGEKSDQSLCDVRVAEWKTAEKNHKSPLIKRNNKAEKKNRLPHSNEQTNTLITTTTQSPPT